MIEDRGETEGQGQRRSFRGKKVLIHFAPHSLSPLSQHAARLEIPFAQSDQS
jgi:hypothetical protein